MAKTRTLRRAVAACCVGLLVTAAPASMAAYGSVPARHLQATTDVSLDVSSAGNGTNSSLPPILDSGTDITTATPDVPSDAPPDTNPPRRDEASVSPEVTTAPPAAPSTTSPDINTPPPAPSTTSPAINTPPVVPSTASPVTYTEAPVVPSTVNTNTNTAPPASVPATSGESNTVSSSSGVTFTNTDSNTPSPDTTFTAFTSDSSTTSPSPASTSITSTSTNSSSASADEEERSADTPETSVRNGADTSTGAPSTDDRVETGASNDRSAGLSTEGIIGIAVGGVGLVALVVAFVRVGSSNRKKSRQSTPDFGSSTGSLNDVRYVDSFDSPAESLASSATVSANQKPSAPPGSQDLSSSSADSTAAAAGQSSSGTGNASTTEDGEFNPSQTAQAISKPQGAMEDPKPVASESFVAYAPLDSQSNLEPARRSSRHSHVFEDEEGSSPILVRFSRRSVQSNDGDIPMLGRYSNKRRLHSPRDNHIPVLSRGSEESVDSIEDEEIEISI